MSALTSLLARDEVVPVQSIEDALQRQVLEGGDLDTALLELGAVPENTLNAYRAASFASEPASREDLMSVSDAALCLVSVEVARSFRVVPLGRNGGTLTVAAGRPLDPDARRSLLDALAGTISDVVVKVAVEVRIEAALAIFYGIDISGRMRMLAEQLDAAPAGTLPEVRRPAETRGLDIDPGLLSAMDSEPPPPPGPQRAHVGAAQDGHEEGDEDDPDDSEDALDLSGLNLPKAPAVPNVSVAPVVSVVPDAPPADAGRPDGGEGERADAASAPRAMAGGPAGAGKRPASRPRFRRVSAVPKGPLSAHKARALLESVQDRDGIVDVFFSFARQYFDCTVLFAARADRVLGLEAYGIVDVGDISGISVPIAPGSAIEDVARSLLPRVANLSKREADTGLCQALGRGGAQPAALIPVCIKQRAVMVLYGDRDGEPFKLEDLGDLLGVLPGVVRAFERVIRSRKLFAAHAQRVGRASRPPASPAAVADKAAPAAASSHDDGEADARAHAMSDAQAQALSAIGKPRSAPPPPNLGESTAGEAPESPSEAEDRTDPGKARREPAREEGAAGDDPADQPTVQLPAQPSPVVGASDAASGARPADAPGPLVEGAGKLSPARRPPAAHPTKPPPGTGAYRSVAPGPAESLGQTGPPRAPRSERRTSPERPGSRPSRARSDAGASPAGSVGSSGDGSAGGAAEDPAAERSTRYSVRPGTREVVSFAATEAIGEAAPPGGAAEPSRGSGAEARQDTGPQPEGAEAGEGVTRSDLPLVDRERSGEPSIIVDIGADVSALVDELCGCGPDDEGPVVRSLLKLGPAVLPTLVSRFPGPLWFDRHRPHKRLPRARDVSAIARAMAAFRGEAGPYLADLLSHESPDVRFYAALLAVEQPAPEVLAALGDAVFDQDPQVRLLVREALWSFRDVDGFAEVLARWRERASDAGAAVQARLDAVSALAAVRDEQAVALLIELNGHSDKQLAVPAHRALIAITAQDFGKSTRKWRSWLKKAAELPRMQWLIESLGHSDEQLRAVAGNELQKASQKYFGYVASAPKRDRDRAQTRYRKWWESEGKQQFARSGT